MTYRASRHTRVVLALVGGLMCCAGCVAPSAATPCVDDTQCPAGYVCERQRQFCYQQAKDAQVDAGRDALTPEDAQVDAGRDVPGPGDAQVDAGRDVPGPGDAHDVELPATEDAAVVDAASTREDGPTMLQAELVAEVEIDADVHTMAVAGDRVYLGIDDPEPRILTYDSTQTSSPIAVTPLAGPARGISLHGERLYVANAGPQETRVQIFRDDGLAQLTMLGAFAVAGEAQDVALQGVNAYVVSHSTGEDLEVFDVSDPSTVTKLGGLEIMDEVQVPTHEVTAVVVQGTVAFTLGKELQSVDVSDPELLVVLDRTDILYWYGKDLQLVGDQLYGIEDNNGNDRQLHVWDVTDPSHLLRIGFADTTLSHPRDLLVVGESALIAGGWGGGFFDVFDIANPAAPVQVLSERLTNDAYTLALVGDHVWIGMHRNHQGELRIYSLR